MKNSKKSSNDNRKKYGKYYAEMKVVEVLENGREKVQCARCGYVGSFDKIGHCPNCKSITKKSRVELAKVNESYKVALLAE